MFQAELFAVRQKPQEVARISAAGHDQDVTEPGIHQRLDGVVNHRPVIDRQQMLVGDLGQREEPTSRAPGEYDALHKQSPSYNRETGERGAEGATPWALGPRRTFRPASDWLPAGAPGGFEIRRRLKICP